MFASSKAKEIVNETMEKKQIQALESNKNLDDVDMRLNFKECREVIQIVKSQRTARKLDKEANKMVDSYKSPSKMADSYKSPNKMADSYKSPPKKADFNRLQTSILSGAQESSENPALEGTKQRLRDEMHLKKL